MDTYTINWIKFFIELFNDEIEIKKQLINTLDFDNYFKRMDDIEERRKHKMYDLLVNNHNKTIFLRDINCTNLILAKMSSNIFIQKMEETISTDIRYWEQNSLYLPSEPSTSYVFWFFFEQALYYRKFSKEIINYSTKNGIDNHLNAIAKRNKLLRELIPIEETFYLSEELDFFIKDMINCRLECQQVNSDRNTLLNFQAAIALIIENFTKILLKVAKDAIDFSESGGKIECKKQEKNS